VGKRRLCVGHKVRRLQRRRLSRGRLTLRRHGQG
jgi:hypothetical protein